MCVCAVDRVMHLTAIATAEGIEAVPSNTHTNDDATQAVNPIDDNFDTNPVRGLKIREVKELCKSGRRKNGERTGENSPKRQLQISGELFKITMGKKSHSTGHFD